MNTKGFTIISVLVAMVLLSIGVLALSRTTAKVLTVHSDAGARTNALAIARGYMEQVRASDARDLKSVAPVTVDDTGEPDAAGHYTRSLVVTEVEHNLVEVKVTVDFPRFTKPVELVTLAYQRPLI